MSLSIAAWFVDKALGKLLERKLEGFLSRMGLKEDFLQRLELQMTNIKIALDNAARMQIQSETLVEAIDKLRQLAGTAEDLLDELDYYRLRQQVQGTLCGPRREPSPSQQSIAMGAKRKVCEFLGAGAGGLPKHTQDSIRRRIEEVIGHLGTIADAMPSYLNLELLHSISRALEAPTECTFSQTTSFTSNRVFGRSGEKEHIVELVTGAYSPHCLSVLPIVGIGGIGKTTLARLVYKDPSVVSHFDLRMWISLSFDFDEVSITRELLEYVAGDRHEGIKNVNILYEKVMHYLQFTRFLLVLDGMWWDVDKERWGNLLAPLTCGQEKGNVILVTTRKHSVAEMISKEEPIRLEGIEGDEYWSLFRECAFSNEIEMKYDLFESTGREIAKKLDGHPLAAISVGALLRSKPNVGDWGRILESNGWKHESRKNDIIPTLQMSYEYLPMYLQRCFAICSLFPKNYKFFGEDLFRMWAAQELLTTKSGTIQGDKESLRLDKIGIKYLNSLVDSSLFEKVECHGNTHYHMPDLVHDMSQKVSSYECFTVDGSEYGLVLPSVRHLSIITGFAYRLGQDSHDKLLKQLNNVAGALEIESLSTLLLTGRYDSNFSETFRRVLEKARRLRMVRLSTMSGDVDYMLCNFAKFIHLRYLQLQSDDDYNELPTAICYLYHLLVLDVKGWRGLTYLPDEISNLINLRYLVAERELHSVIAGVGKLTFLQELQEFNVGKASDFEIAQLRRLQELGGSLSICNLENVESKEEAEAAGLIDKLHLSELKLSWDKMRQARGNSRSVVIEAQVLQGLQPHPNLKKLSIISYDGDTSPTWLIDNRSFNYLESIHLEDCKAWKDLPPLGQLPHLKELHLISIPAVIKVGVEFYGNDLPVGFPSLEELEFSDMEEWTRWLGSENLQLFPSLKCLKIINCPKLRETPQIPPSYELILVGCPLLINNLS